MSSTNKYSVRLSALAIVCVGVLTFPLTPARGDGYFYLDYKELSFAYRVVNSAPQVGGVIGNVVIQRDFNSDLTASKYSFGPNGRYDAIGPDDALLAFVDIPWHQAFSVSLTADVIYYGPNNYRVVSTGAGLTGTDSGTANVYAAAFTSSSISWNGTDFNMTGNLSSLPGNDSILLGSGESWTFNGTYGWDLMGNQQTTAIGLSGVGSELRSQYDSGRLLEVHWTMSDGTPSLDNFFASDRDNFGADMKVSIIPVPASAVLGAIGMIALPWFRRRTPS